MTSEPARDGIDVEFEEWWSASGPEGTRREGAVSLARVAPGSQSKSTAQAELARLGLAVET